MSKQASVAQYYKNRAGNHRRCWIASKVQLIRTLAISRTTDHNSSFTLDVVLLSCAVGNNTIIKIFSPGTQDMDRSTPPHGTFTSALAQSVTLALIQYIVHSRMYHIDYTVFLSTCQKQWSTSSTMSIHVIRYWPWNVLPKYHRHDKFPDELLLCPITSLNFTMTIC